MKTTITLFAVSAFCIISSISAESRPDRIVEFLSSLRQITLALKQFKLDAAAAEQPTDYPKSLDDLTKSNYISKENLLKLTKEKTVIYIPSQDLSLPKDILLLVVDKDLLGGATVDGNYFVTNTETLMRAK